MAQVTLTSEEEKAARKQAWKAYYAANKERLKKAALERYHLTKESTKGTRAAYQKEWIKNNKERIREYRRANRDKLQADKRKKYHGDEKTRNHIKNKIRLWKKLNPEKAKGQDLMECYGMMLLDYQALLDKQKGVCAVCGKSGSEHKRVKHLSVDHDHKTGAIRGLLCSHCNLGIGQFKDNPEWLRRAAAYLENAAANQPSSQQAKAS